MINNFGSLGFFFLVIAPTIYTSYFLARQFSCSCCKRYTDRLQDKLFYNTILRLIIESYVIGIICIFLNVRDIEFHSGDNWTFANAVLTVIFLPIFALFPFLSIRVMYYGRDRMNDRKSVEGRKFHNKFGELFAGYETREKSMLFFWFIEYMRKILLACVVVFTQTHLWLQIFVIYNSSIFLIIASGYIKVRKTKFGDRMDKFNEIKIIFIVYHLMLFTMFVPNPETKFQIGYSCAIVVVVGTVVNMSELISNSFRLMRKRARLTYHKKKVALAILDRRKRPRVNGYIKRKRLFEEIEKTKLQREAYQYELTKLGFTAE